MPRITGAGGEGVQAVVLALRILEHLAHDGRPVGVTALARALGTTKSRIHRHLQTLAQEGYILQAADTERYQVGARLAALGRLAGDTFDLASVAAGTLRELRDTLGHFSVVSEVEPEGIRVLATMPGKSSVEIGVKRGSLLSLHGSAQGKVALAFGDESLRQNAFRSRLELLTPKTIVSPAVLRRELDLVRRRGWAVAPNEALIGVNALAAPVFGATGALVGTVAIVDSIQFIEEEPTAEQVERVREAGWRISAALGHSSAGAVPVDMRVP
jgi:IclR family transcriptional regulator, KDG regulon repressor